MTLCYPVGMIENPSDLQSILEVETRAYPNALSECRKANSDFCETVKAELAH
ncbi:hypothetical protein [Aliagarivorans taiwanensis]|uniref:hypothetical protein n=1 Tax=Aliagarivorans taiwanensis TaxID=561966 RepID=UPI00146FB2E1|nr:hypothetical protein [Aliagarivorans taiwanensis]